MPVVISFFVCGIVAGLLFDLFKVKRIILGYNKLILFFDDFVFMLICSVIVIFNAYAFNDGNLKWYEIPLLCLGFFTYTKLFSSIIMGLFSFLIEAIKRIIAYLLLPLKKILRCFTVLHLRLRLCINYSYAKRKVSSIGL